MSSALHLPETVKQASPSTRLVYAVLDDQGPLTLEEILQETGVARRTAKKAIATLRRRDLATATEHPTDYRRRLYAASDNQSPSTP